MNATSRLSCLLIALGACTASAMGDTLTLASGAYSNGGNGGAYTATINSGPANNYSYNSLAVVAGSFETFCLEPTEFFSPGNTYDYTIASYAFGGSTEAVARDVGPGDQLSLGTTWLYAQFASGSLSSATYASATRKANMLLLQRAFWYLEDDYTAYSTDSNALASNAYLTLVANQFGGGTVGLAAAQANAAAGAYGVWALNLTTGSGANIVQNQSQLYYHQVPEGGMTVVFLGFALLGIARVRRSFGSR